MGWIEDLEKKHQEKTAKETVEKKTAELTELQEDQVRAAWFEQRLVEGNTQRELEYATLQANVAAYTDALKAACQFMKDAIERLKAVGVKVHLFERENQRQIYFPNMEKMIEHGFRRKVIIEFLEQWEFGLVALEFPEKANSDYWKVREIPAYEFRIISVLYPISKGTISLKLSEFTAGMIELEYIGVYPNTPSENMNLRYKNKMIGETFYQEGTDYAVPLYEDERETGLTATFIHEKRDLPVSELTQKNLERLLKWICDFGRGEIIGQTTLVYARAAKRGEGIRYQITKERIDWTVKRTLTSDYVYLLGFAASLFVWSYVTVCLGLPMALIFLGVFGYRVFLNWDMSGGLQNRGKL